jgi:hypothetical protein
MDATLAINRVLKQAVDHRIEGLKHAKKSFKRRYHLDTNHSTEPNVSVRISKLLEDVERFDPAIEDGFEEWTPETTKRFIEQAQDDRSISETRLLDLEKRLQGRLNKHLNRIEVSYLHVDLMREALDADVSIEKAAIKLETSSLDDDFEMVEEGLEELLEQFKKKLLTPTDVDPDAIQAYLSSMFTGEEAIHLQGIRNNMQAYGNELANGNMEIDQEGLHWAITDLMDNSLICPRKKETLGAYLQSPIALQGLATTLKMKKFHSWNYKNAETGLPITVRQDSDGQYRVVVEEDIVDMLFLHCTAMGWALNLKECLTNAAHNTFVSTPLSQAELDKRSYFLSSSMPNNGLQMMHHPSNPYGLPGPPPLAQPYMSYPMPPCPPQPPTRNAFVRRKSKKPRHMRTSHMPTEHMPPPPPGSPNELNSERKRKYLEDFFMRRSAKYDGFSPKVPPLEKMQAELLKTLVAEFRLRKAFDGEAHVSASNFESLETSIPHETIIAVLNFLGVPEACLDFFTRFLETKLHVGPDKAVKRTRGVSVGHAMEMLFSEAVLFFLDLAVYRKTGSFLYRLYDHCYFVGTYDQVKAANEETNRFSELMGLEAHDTCANGKLSIGCLTLDVQVSSPEGTMSAFKIDDDKVTAYAHRTKTELGACKTVIDWVTKWNKTAGRYAAHLFGPLANAFGKPHLEAVKAAYKRINSIIFDGSDLTTHVTTLLSPHTKYHFNNYPLALDPFIYLPQACGGLGVKNPFTAFSLAHEIHEDPFTEIQKYLAEEDRYYTISAQRYALSTPEQRQQKLAETFGENATAIAATLGLNPSNPTTPIPFITKEDLFKDRERATYPMVFYPDPTPSLISLYSDLLKEPSDHVQQSNRIERDLHSHSRKRHMTIGNSWHSMTAEEQWVLNMYSDECYEQYGTLEIWWPEGVPVEIYEALRGNAHVGGCNRGSPY